MVPQPVTQVSMPLKKMLFEAARQTGAMKSVKVTDEDSLKRAMSLSLVSGL